MTPEEKEWYDTFVYIFYTAVCLHFHLLFAYIFCFCRLLLGQKKKDKILEKKRLQEEQAAANKGL